MGLLYGIKVSISYRDELDDSQLWNIADKLDMAIGVEEMEEWVQNQLNQLNHLPIPKSALVVAVDTF